ncbi:MAG TPA: hypothetical protein VK970_00990 [Candidatus Methylacidiphilales bacterium]|nr:hypothetical protein [Candidatus Methylacidiphilales bacterium]
MVRLRRAFGNDELKRRLSVAGPRKVFHHAGCCITTLSLEHDAAATLVRRVLITPAAPSSTAVARIDPLFTTETKPDGVRARARIYWHNKWNSMCVDVPSEARLNRSKWVCSGLLPNSLVPGDPWLHCGVAERNDRST